MNQAPGKQAVIHEQSSAYEPPAIIYEFDLEVRAGSGTGALTSPLDIMGLDEESNP